RVARDRRLVRRRTARREAARLVVRDLVLAEEQLVDRVGRLLEGSERLLAEVLLHARLLRDVADRNVFAVGATAGGLVLPEVRVTGARLASAEDEVGVLDAGLDDRAVRVRLAGGIEDRDVADVAGLELTKRGLRADRKRSVDRDHLPELLVRELL